MLSQLPPRLENRELSNLSLSPFNGRILHAFHFSSDYHLSGYTKRTDSLLNALDSIGLSVFPHTRLGYPWDIAGSSDKQFASPREYHHEADSLGIRRHEEDYIERYSEYLAQRASLLNCCSIHGHSNFFNGLAAVRAARMVNAQSIYEMRGLWHLTRESEEPAYADTEHFQFCHAMELRAADLADQVIVISDALRVFLIENGIDESKIHVAPNAVNHHEILKPRKLDNNGLEQTPFHIGYVGTLRDYEGIDVLLEAILLLRKSTSKIRLTIAGSGPNEGHLHRTAKILGVDREVDFTGSLSDAEVATLYPQLDLAVVPRRRCRVTELVTPLKPFEVMANRVPILVSDVSPLTELVPDGVRGLVHRADDANDLAEKVRFAISNRDEITRMADTASDWLRETSSWTDRAIHYARLYNQPRESGTVEGMPN